MAKFPETDKDVENVEAWAEVIEDLLYLVPPDKRSELLALAGRNEEAKRKEREERGRFILRNALELMADMDTRPGIRHWNAIMRLKSLIVQVFVRDITIDHSPQDAERILFAQHPHGTGSCLLQDYLPDQNVAERQP